jgi:hypothetical protein
MFSRMVPVAITTSCGTYETAPGHFATACSGGSLEIKTFPSSGVSTPSKTSMKVVLPAPEGPTRATDAPAGIKRSILDIAPR